MTLFLVGLLFLQATAGAVSLPTNVDDIIKYGPGYVFGVVMFVVWRQEVKSHAEEQRQTLQQYSADRDKVTQALEAVAAALGAAKSSIDSMGMVERLEQLVRDEMGRSSGSTTRRR